MNALFRLALTLTVAAVICLAPLVSANETDPLDGAKGEWQQAGGTLTRFRFRMQEYDRQRGRQYLGYSGTRRYTQAQGGGEVEINAQYWIGTPTVHLTYRRDQVTVKAALTLRNERGANKKWLQTLRGRWTASDGRTGEVYLWRSL